MRRVIYVSIYVSFKLKKRWMKQTDESNFHYQGTNLDLTKQGLIIT